MTPNDLNRLAIIASAATEGDVRPEDVPALRVPIPGAGWTEHETGLPPPDTDALWRGIGYALPIAVALWIVIGLIGWALYAALRLGVGR